MNNIKKHVVIFSHGFGVRRDDLGLLSDIAAAIPEVESILFDYDDVDEINKTITIYPFSDKIKKLNGVINQARLAYPEAIIDLICHSQGTVVAALARPQGIRKTILLAPPFDMSLDHSLARYRAKPEAEINLDGVSKLPPLDGFVRFVPAQYWQERVQVKPIYEYNAFAHLTELVAISARQDQILPKTDIQSLGPQIKMLSLDGDHSFNGLAREPLIKVIREILF